MAGADGIVGMLIASVVDAVLVTAACGAVGYVVSGRSGALVGLLVGAAGCAYAAQESTTVWPMAVGATARLMSGPAARGPTMRTLPPAPTSRVPGSVPAASAS